MPTADFASAYLNGCVPYTVQFSDSSIAGTQLFYTWYFGDGDSSHLASPVHTYGNVGSYDVTLIVYTTNGCIGIDTFSVPGMVNVFPTPTAGITANPTSVSIFNPFISTFDQSMNGDSCWLDFGDGYAINACDGSHVYWNYGIYNIIQTVYNSYGCYDTAMVTVEVRPEDRFFIPNTFTPNGNGLNDIFMPAILGAEDYHFMIFDRWGELIFETHDVNVGWDGRYKGNKCQEDVYVWRITYTDVVDDSSRKMIGHVNLIR
jgi:gliding motility-associated-like protein